jgi:hypothetical protein
MSVDENYRAAARGLILLAKLARHKAVTRVAELGVIPPVGSPELCAWAEREGIALTGLQMPDEAGA